MGQKEVLERTIRYIGPHEAEMRKLLSVRKDDDAYDDVDTKDNKTTLTLERLYRAL
jgi:hypothetical protein